MYSKNQAVQDAIHKMLESLCRVPKTKRHTQELVHTEGCGDGCFENISLDHRDLMVSLDEIKAGKDRFPLQCLREVFNVSDGVSMWDRSRIQYPIMTATRYSSFFSTICSGDDQLLFDGRMIPLSINF